MEESVVRKGLLTHLEYDRCPEKGYKPLLFILRESTEVARYAYGFDNVFSYQQEDIAAMVAAGGLVPLREPMEIEVTEGIWLGYDGTFWICSRVNPFHDWPRRRLALSYSREGDASPFDLVIVGDGPYVWAG